MRTTRVALRAISIACASVVSCGVVLSSAHAQGTEPVEPTRVETLSGVGAAALARLAAASPEVASIVPRIQPDPGDAVRDASNANATALIKQGDSNSDANLTQREIEAYVPGVSRFAFGYLDRNNDGVLTASEFRPASALPPSRGQNFVRADANADARVSFDEAVVAAPDLTPRRFAALDADKNGALSNSELRRAEDISGPRTVKALVTTADGNLDNAVSFSEAVAFAGMTRAKFDEADKDRDGVISRADTVLRNEAAGATSAEVAVALEADVDADRGVSLRELRAMRPKFSQRLFKDLDKNEDGLISAEDTR